MNRRLLERASPFILLALIVLVWEVVCRAFHVSEFIFPSPSDIWAKLVEFHAVIAQHAWRTFWVTMVGFGIAIVVGVLLGFVIGSSRLAYTASYPLMTAFNALLQVKAATCEERGITLTLDIRSALEGLSMPPWELCCVVGNLLDNAADAAAQAQAPHIALKITESLRSFEFSIQNNGPMIPENLRESIFEAGVTTKGEGHGMGLHIVRQRLNEYDGAIALESDEGETRFIVNLPRESGHAAPKP